MISWFYGRKVLQSFYKKLYSFALKGLNYGIVGSGEKWTLLHIKDCLVNDTPVIFDVGANIGDYSKDLVNVFGKEANVHSFEPVPDTFMVLKKNMEGMPVSLHAFGLGAKEETLEINYSPDQHTFSSVFERKAFENIQSEKIPIRIRTLDAFCAENEIEFIDFIKIDTEGNDFACIEGAAEMLNSKQINFLQFEFGESAIDASKFFKSFWELLSPNYKVYRILKDGLDEIKAYHVRHETFYYSNFLAVVK